MTLTQEDIDFIKANMADWLAEQSLGKPPAVYEIELRERMVRVEEELKHQRELMQAGFAQMDKRFELAERRHEELRQDMLARFEQVDKRFEQVERRFEQMDKRFEQVDGRFDEMNRVNHHRGCPDRRRRQALVGASGHRERAESCSRTLPSASPRCATSIRWRGRRSYRWKSWRFRTASRPLDGHAGPGAGMRAVRFSVCQPSASERRDALTPAGLESGSLPQIHPFHPVEKGDHLPMQQRRRTVQPFGHQPFAFPVQLEGVGAAEGVPEPAKVVQQPVQFLIDDGSSSCVCKSSGRSSACSSSRRNAQ